MSNDNFTPVVVAVNISRSLRERGNDPEQAASHAWLPRSKSQRQTLMNADLVVAVALNVVRGVYRVLSAQPYPDSPERICWELQPLPAYAGVIGQKLNESGTYWKPGMGAAWLEFPIEELDDLQEKAKRDEIDFGPHKIRLLPDGNLLVTLAPGYSAHIESLGKLPTLKERVEPIVQLLGQTAALTTYGTIADALLNYAQPVSRSIVGNENINQSEGARVLRGDYQQEDGWYIPAEDELTSKSGETRKRGEILVEEGLATDLENGKYFVDAGSVITDAATLRRYLRF
ncbi:hypothetical protein [Trueperella pyogenes]|uniref:hypothetical protein n=1 Tax=Trueperella pyogenes TaxID=1661 RepID=UPI00345D63A1